MNNRWFNLSSGCQRTAWLDYFLGRAVTFIGSDSRRIGEKPLLGREQVSDGETDEEKDGAAEKETSAEAKLL